MQSQFSFGTVIGAHIPVLSSEVGFFDVVYLGVFIMLSPAFDRRFYNGKPPSELVDEAACAKAHFLSILHIFNERYIILLGGDVVAHSYVVNRMLGEFAAAAVVFAKAIWEKRGKDYDDDEITASMFTEHVEDILQRSHSKIFPYYSHCLDRVHKHFQWTGPKVDILPRSEGSDVIVPIPTVGELRDLPSQQIYLDPTPANSIPRDAKSHDRGDGVDKDSDGPPRKRRS